MVALNVETENGDGCECQNWEAMVALNAETWEAMMALNAEIEKQWWLWI